jgi:hypothetical protein
MRNAATKPRGEEDESGEDDRSDADGDAAGPSQSQGERKRRRWSKKEDEDTDDGMDKEALLSGDEYTTRRSRPLLAMKAVKK